VWSSSAVPVVFVQPRARSLVALAPCAACLSVIGPTSPAAAMVAIRESRKKNMRRFKVSAPRNRLQVAAANQRCHTFTQHAEMKKRIVVSLLMTTLASCATDPNAGMVAARNAGVGSYLQFTRNGKPDSAALLPFEGRWWFYHPSNGSTSTGIPASSPPPTLAARLYLDGISGKPTLEEVKAFPLTAELQNGCLPRALSEVRMGGGVLQKAPGHVQVTRSLTSPDTLSLKNSQAVPTMKVAQSRLHPPVPSQSPRSSMASTPAKPHAKYTVDKYGTQYLYPTS
jgi:hypothetical protein